MLRCQTCGSRSALWEWCRRCGNPNPFAWFRMFRFIVVMMVFGAAMYLALLAYQRTQSLALWNQGFREVESRGVPGAGKYDEANGVASAIVAPRRSEAVVGGVNTRALLSPFFRPASHLTLAPLPQACSSEEAHAAVRREAATATASAMKNPPSRYQIK